MTEIVLCGSIRVPVWVKDLNSFRRWSLSDEYPNEGQISFLDGMLWVDPSMERDAHNQLKMAIAIALGTLNQAKRLGRLYGDNMRLVHPEAGLATEPDGSFVLKDSLQRQRVQLLQGDDSVELIGSPDMVLEVVSPTSVEKDTILLPELYFRAGVCEYWLVNPLGKTLDFSIFRRTPKKFVAVRPQGGWVRSAVFGQEFRLIAEIDDLDLSEYTLEVR